MPASAERQTDARRLVEHLRATGELGYFIEHLVELVGLEGILAALSPKRRKALLRLALQEEPPPTNPSE